MIIMAVVLVLICLTIIVATRDRIKEKP